MTSTTDEEWSIISSSDYEDDLVSPQSMAHTESGDDHENYDDDLAAASVSTVRPESTLIFGSNIRLVPGSTPGLPQGGEKVLGPGGANRPRAPGAPLVPEKVRLTPVGPHTLVFAPLVALYSAVRRAAVHTRQYICDTDGAIKERLRKIFGGPLALWRRSLELQTTSESKSKSKCAVYAVSTTALSGLEAIQHILLYVVILVTFAAFAGTVVGAKQAISEVLGIHQKTSLQFMGNFQVQQFGGRVIDFDNFHVWAHKNALWFTGFKAKCSEKAWHVLNLVLYEDRREKSSWFGRILHHEPARQLRFAKFWAQLNDHLLRGWRSIQEIPARNFLLSLGEKLPFDILSDFWTSWWSKIKHADITLVVNSRFSEFRKILIILGKRSYRTYEDLARKLWSDISSASQPGFESVANTLNETFDSAKNWYFLGGPDHFRNVVIQRSKTFGGHDFKWVSSKFVNFTDSVSLMASECQKRVDTVEKREQLVNAFKDISQKGFNVFSRRLQLAARDAYHLSKSVAALVRS